MNLTKVRTVEQQLQYRKKEIERLTAELSHFRANEQNCLNIIGENDRLKAEIKNLRAILLRTGRNPRSLL